MGVRPLIRNETVWLAALTAVFAVSALWTPSDEGGFVLCLFRQFTGLPCMGCGLTRSFCALAKGEVARAFHFHALGPVIFAVAAAYWVRCLALVAGRVGFAARFDAAARRARLGAVGLVLLLAVWAVNLVALGLDGRLAAMAREGALYRAVSRATSGAGAPPSSPGEHLATPPAARNPQNS